MADATCGQTPRLRELLWEPLAVAALNQSPAAAAAAPFARGAGADVQRHARRDAAIGLPRVPLDELYAEPARRWLEARGRQVRAGAPPRRSSSTAAAPSGVDLRGERIEAGAVVSSVPWFSFPALVAAASRRSSRFAATPRAMAASPIVTVNLWLRPRR